MVFIAILVAIVGIFIGGVINALADDLPDYNRPRLPHYADGTPRPFSAWLGITAFLTNQRHPAADPKVRLSWRYPLTEITTGLLFFVVMMQLDNFNADGLVVNGVQIVFWLFYIATFVLITVTDIEHHLILFSVIIPSSLVALIDAVLTPTSEPYPVWSPSAEPELANALAGAGLGFAVFFLFFLGGFVYIRVSAELRGESIDDVAFGYGDVMLITLCGLILGWQSLIFAMFITVFLGAIGAVLFITIQKLRRRDNSMMIALPYGPYIIIGATVMLLFSDWVREVLLTAAYG